MACVEWSGLINRRRERLRNVNFYATVRLKTQPFYLYLCGYMRAPACPVCICITKGHSFTRCGAHVPYPLPIAARISKSVQSEVLHQFHKRAQTPTSQHIIRMHTLPSLIRNLKQVRRSLFSRDREMWICLRIALFGLFLILTLQHRLLRS